MKKEMWKKIIIIILIISFIGLVTSVTTLMILKNKNKEEPFPVEELEELPKPEITGGSRGELGIDKNINEETIDKYLGRSDSVYRDMRLLEDPASYENIGGDKFLSGYIEGFEVIPLPYIVPVTGLPSEVGETYTGTTLFYEDNGRYVANYKESMQIIEEIFPKDKVIFLMCGGGGYAGMTKNFLVAMGWDENKIYNVGGHWYYKGEHNIDVKKEVNGVVTYDFDNVPYHKIDFNKLTKSDDYKAPIVKVSELKINTSTLEIEEETTFKLNVIVLPNDATTRDIKWESSNEKVVTVSNEGLVKGEAPGKATVTATSIEGEKKISCEVTITKRDTSLHLKMDDISSAINELNSYDVRAAYELLRTFDMNPDGTLNEKYYYEDGGRKEQWDIDYQKNQNNIEDLLQKRAKVIDDLMDAKKNFIILYHQKICDAPDYYVYGGAKEILTANNYTFFDVSDSESEDGTLYRTQIDFNAMNIGSIIIIDKGKIIASIDLNVDAIGSDDDLKSWLNKYIDVK